MLESMSITEDLDLNPKVDSLAKKLAEACSCAVDSDDYQPLNTAAKYIVKLQAPSQSQDNRWLADRMLDLAKKMPDEESAEKLANMANSLQNGGKVGLDQVNYALDQVKEFTGDSITESIKRLKELGGIF